jgi:hypothetical protein
LYASFKDADGRETILRRYFFDVDDDGRQVRDKVGKELINLKAAEMQSGMLLRSLRSLRQMQGRPGTSYVSVRDVSGRKVHQASAHLDG